MGLEVHKEQEGEKGAHKRKGVALHRKLEPLELHRKPVALEVHTELEPLVLRREPVLLEPHMVLELSGAHKPLVGMEEQQQGVHTGLRPSGLAG